MNTPFFPDNQNRSDRVNQLTTQTAVIQSSMQDIENAILSQSAANAQYLNMIASEAGYGSPEQYLQAGLNALSPAQKANYANLCKNLVAVDPAFVDSINIAGWVGAVGLFMNIGLTKIVAVFCKFSTFLQGMRGILRGLVMIFKGAVEDGMATVKVFGQLLKVNYSRSLVVGEEGADMGLRAARIFRWIGRAGKVLQWAGLLAEAGLLVYSAVEGAKEKTELQQAITESFATRFSVKKVQLLMLQVQTWQSSAASLVSTQAMLQSFSAPAANSGTNTSGSGNAAPSAAILTPAEISANLTQFIDEHMVSNFDTEMKACDEDSVVVSQLAALDASAAQPAWTNEDPTLDEVKAWVKAHPMTDNNGNVINLDGPLDAAGLQWSGNTVKSSSQAQSATATGVNTAATAVQNFKTMAVSLGLPNTSATTTLFTGSSYGVTGSGTTPDVTVTATGSSGVSGLGALTVSPADKNGYVKITVATATGSPYIRVPPGGSVTFTLTGNTTAAGKTEVLAQEAWFPDGTKSYADVTVTKV